MAELPFWPGLNGSSTSPNSLRAMWRTSVAMDSTVVPTEAQAHRYSAWRSRETTWVAGVGVSPRARQTCSSTRGSMLE